MPFLLDPERLEAMSQGVAVSGCAGLPSGSKRRRFQVAVRLPWSRLRLLPRAACRRPRVHPWNGMKRDKVVLLRNGRDVSLD